MSQRYYEPRSPSRSGGIGRRAWFRAMCPQGCGGSNPPFGTTNFRSERHAAPNHVGEHPKVTHETIQRVLECRRPVLLHREMAYPREPVSEQRRQRKKPPPLRDNRVAKREQDEHRPGEVQAPRAAPAVLGE